MWWSSRSQLDDAVRMIQAQKFYKTLAPKLDAEEEKWLEAQPEDDEVKWEFKENGTFGKDGWSISTSYKDQ